MTQLTTHHALPQTLDDMTLPPQLPPLVIMAFTRPELLAQVLSSIERQTLMPSRILAFLDGARGPQDEPLIQACVALLEDFGQILPVEIVVRPQNLGCDRNAITTLDEVCDRYESLIYLEDDAVVNPDFYDRMCRLLTAYRDYPQVCSVSGFANFPNELEASLDRDFMVSNRIFSFGFGLWADRWRRLNLARQAPSANPFGDYYRIPATIQTKYTILNQFFLEKNAKTDWVITLTLNALFHNLVHITPKASLLKNIGFGHPEAKTYRGAEPMWANFRYDPEVRLNQLPDRLDLMPTLAMPLSGRALANHLGESGSVWLSLAAMRYFLRRYRDPRDWLAFGGLFISRSRLLMRRWRSSLPL